MSSLLVNLARRGAGLPTTTIQAPPSSPFGPEIRQQGNELTEAHVQPSVGEPAATTKTPSLGSPPVPRPQVISPGRESEPARMAPSERTVTPYPTEREVITKIEVERGRHTSASASHEIEPVGEPARHASSVISAPAILIQELDERQVVALPELSAERPRIAAQQTPETALPAPTIRPALAESHTLLDFPRVPSNSSLTPSAQLPIHVRIGRVEVRGTTAPAPTRPGPPAPLGFDSYYRVRNYRS
jgi:hypothetical protein